MPELPDVQYYVDYFKKYCLDKKIKRAKINEPSFIKKGNASQINRGLAGKEFLNARRRGKLMIVETKGEPDKLVFHYGMTGDLKYTGAAEITERDKKYARLVVEFEDSGELFWINVRRFGKIYFVSDINEIDLLRNMGPEPLELTQSGFLELLEEHASKNIKAFFMDQSDIAGIGNEYSNEILFQAGLDPHRHIESLSSEQKKDLYKTTERVLKKAIATKPGPLPENWLTAHKTGKDCPKDGTHKLTKETIAGRGALFCRQHQT